MHGESRSEHRRSSTVSVLNWIGVILIAAIPVVNIIMWIIWAVSNKYPSKKNYAIASLIMLVVFIVAAFTLMLFFGDAFVAMLKEYAAMPN